MQIIFVINVMHWLLQVNNQYTILLFVASDPKSLTHVQQWTSSGWYDDIFNICLCNLPIVLFVFFLATIRSHLLNARRTQQWLIYDCSSVAAPLSALRCRLYTRLAQREAESCPPRQRRSTSRRRGRPRQAHATPITPPSSKCFTKNLCRLELLPNFGTVLLAWLFFENVHSLEARKHCCLVRRYDEPKLR